MEVLTLSLLMLGVAGCASTVPVATNVLLASAAVADDVVVGDAPGP